MPCLELPPSRIRRSKADHHRLQMPMMPWSAMMLAVGPEKAQIDGGTGPR